LDEDYIALDRRVVAVEAEALAAAPVPNLFKGLGFRV
jgi:hypothetical protein